MYLQLDFGPRSATSYLPEPPAEDRLPPPPELSGQSSEQAADCDTEGEATGAPPLKVKRTRSSLGQYATSMGGPVAAPALQLNKSRSSVGHDCAIASDKHHPLRGRRELLDTIKLIFAQDFSTLPCPWPRSQDIPEWCFGTPDARDIVVSVSHAWRNQAHPDPLGSKHKIICGLLEQAGLQREGVLLFLDWAAIPQRPFKPDQARRTELQKRRFKAALHEMHNMYFYADRIVHIDLDVHSAAGEIEGEGREFSLTARELAGAQYGQIGDWVQIVGDGRPRGIDGVNTMDPHSLQATWGHFDRVVSVDGEPVDSLAMLLERLAAPVSTKDGCRVKLCRYPFGRVNRIPADSRGWVFLERFITMVKCAMLEEAAAMSVVLTNSPQIRGQILTGARRLREAATKDDAAEKKLSGSGSFVADGSQLRSAFDDFLAELATKQFSAASTDKLEIDALATEGKAAGEPSSDRELVGDIMREFVEHLCEHWSAEARRQETQARRLRAILKAAGSFFFEWDRFSGPYVERLRAASLGDPRPMAALVVVPPALSLCWMLLPFARPDAGWRAQGLWLGFGQPLDSLLCYHIFPELMVAVAAEEGTFGVRVRQCTWTCTVALLSSGIRAAAAWWWDVFPVPMVSLIAAAIIGPFLPFLVLCVPRERRTDWQFRKKAISAVIFLFASLGIFGAAQPLLNVGIVQLSFGWQVIAILGHVLLKFGFEQLCLVSSTRIGADVMPVFAFVGAYFYRFNVCTLLSEFEPLIFSELIFVDLMQNGYHLWSLARQQTRQLAAEHGLDEAARKHAEGSQMYVTARLILQVFIQALVPLQFMAEIVLMWSVMPEFNNLVCDKSYQQMRGTVIALLANVGVDLAFAVFMSAFLHRHGVLTHRVLQGLLVEHQAAFLACAVCTSAYVMGLQHSHAGSDMSFTFAWLRSPHARWECGLRWTG